jgi:tellurite resistance protein TehA-like permease
VKRLDRCRPVRLSTARRSRRRAGARAGVFMLLAFPGLAVAPACAVAAVAGTPGVNAQQARTAEPKGSSLESAAAKAGSTGRAVAMSLIGLAFAVAATVLAFRRDFKEAAGVFAVGIVSVLLATPAGVNLLRATVTSLFGSG